MDTSYFLVWDLRLPVWDTNIVENYIESYKVLKQLILYSYVIYYQEFVLYRDKTIICKW